MSEIAFHPSGEKDKRATAMNNLLILAREKAGTELMYRDGIVSKIRQLLKFERNEEIIATAIRIVAELCKDDVDRMTKTVQELGIPWVLEMINGRVLDRVNAAQYCMQVYNDAVNKHLCLYDRFEDNGFIFPKIVDNIEHLQWNG